MPGRPLHFACGAPSELPDASNSDPYAPERYAPPSEEVVLAALKAHAGEVKEKDLYGRLPIHWLVRHQRAPIAAVQALLAAYPEAARTADIRGLLPLHHACLARAPDEVVFALLGAHEAAVRTKDSNKLLPLHHALAFRSTHPHGDYQAQEGDAVALLDVAALDLHAQGVTDDSLKGDAWRLFPTLTGTVIHTLPLDHSRQPYLVASSDLLFWHRPGALQPAAHVSVSLPVVDRLLTLYPQAAKEADVDGRVPLLYAAASACPLPVIQRVLAAHPPAASMRDYGWLHALHAAAYAGAPTDVIQLLLEAHPPAAQAQTKRKRFAVHEACAGRAPSAEVVESLLLAHPAAANAPDIDGRLPLHYAARAAPAAAITALVTAGGKDSLLHKDRKRLLPLHHVTSSTTAPAVQVLLEACPQAAKERTEEGMLPLHQAVSAHAAAAIPVLVEAYPAALRDKTNDYTALPLHCAKGGGPAMVQALLALADGHPGALKERDGLGRLPLHCLLSYPNADAHLVSRMLTEYPAGARMSDGWSCLPAMTAVKAGVGADVVRLLLAAQPLTDADMDSSGCTALQLLSPTYVGAAVVRLLLASCPAMARVRSADGRTAFACACAASADVEAVSAVLEAYPNALTVNASRKRSPLFFALAPAYWPCPPATLRLLLTLNPAAVRERTHPDGITIMALACSRPVVQLYELQALLDVHPAAATETTTQSGNSPLFRISVQRMLWCHTAIEVAALVLRAHKQAAATKTTEGFLPLHAATERSGPETVSLVLSAHPEGAQTPAGVAGSLPLHMLNRNASVASVVAVIQAFPAAVKQKQLSDGGLPLHHACWNGCSTSVVSAILDEYPEAASALDDVGNAPLMHAALGASYEAVCLLLEADVSTAKKATKPGQIPLHAACLRSDKAVVDTEWEHIVDKLLDVYPEGASVKDTANDGKLALHHSVSGSATAVVQRLLQLYPGAAREKASRLQAYPLHLAHRDPTVFKLLLEAFPEAAQSLTGVGHMTALHAMFWWGMGVMNLDSCRALVAAHPQCTSSPNSSGHLPLALASPSSNVGVVEFVLASNPAAASASGARSAYALHVALGGYDDVEKPWTVNPSTMAAAAVVRRLLSAYPDAVHKKTTRGRLPLHFLAMLRESVPAAVVLEDLLSAYTDGLKERTLDTTSLPLHLAVQCGALPSVQLKLLSRYLEAAKEEDKAGMLPLALAMQQETLHTVVAGIFGAHPDAVFHRCRADKEPFEYLAARVAEGGGGCYPDALIARMLLHSLPFDPATGKDREGQKKRSYAWNLVMESFDDLLVGAVEQVLDACTAHIDKLAQLPDKLGRHAIDVATPKCRKAISRRLFLFGRYKLRGGRSEHESTTSIVRYAMDYGAAAKAAASSTAGSSDAVTPAAPRTVVLKFMRNEEQFRREMAARGFIGERSVAAAQDTAEGGAGGGAGSALSTTSSVTAEMLHPDFVVPIIRAHSSTTDDSVCKELRARKLDSHPYVLVFPAADRALSAIIDHEREAQGWIEEVRMAARHLARALAHLHGRGVIHGDIKPRNIVREGRVYKLIDLDAAANFSKGEYAGQKTSTAFLPPEMLVVAQDGSKGVLVRTPHAPHDQLDKAPPLLANPALDMWAFGATLFQMLTGQSLLHADTSDNAADDAQLRLCARWLDRDKNEKLSLVRDPNARHLLSMLLYRDPAMRIEAAQLAHNSFITGRDAVRLPGQEPDFDVFLSYRVQSDLVHAEALYYAFTSAGLRVWWDKRCLETGKVWRDGFCDGLAKSRAFLPIISRGAVKAVDMDGEAILSRNWESLEADSNLDNVLLEHRMALELRERRLLELICPVFVGDEVQGSGDGADPDTVEYGKYFAAGCAPRPAAVVVEALEEELKAQLARAGLGTPLRQQMTVGEVWQGVTDNQAPGFIEGKRGPAYEAIMARLAAAIQPPMRMGAGASGPEDAWTATLSSDDPAAVSAVQESAAAELRGELAAVRHEMSSLRAAHTAAVARAEELDRQLAAARGDSASSQQVAELQARLAAAEQQVKAAKTAAAVEGVAAAAAERALAATAVEQAMRQAEASERSKAAAAVDKAVAAEKVKTAQAVEEAVAAERAAAAEARSLLQQAREEAQAARAEVAEARAAQAVAELAAKAAAAAATATASRLTIASDPPLPSPSAGASDHGSAASHDKTLAALREAESAALARLREALEAEARAGQAQAAATATLEAAAQANAGAAAAAAAAGAGAGGAAAAAGRGAAGDGGAGWAGSPLCSLPSPLGSPASAGRVGATGRTGVEARMSSASAFAGGGAAGSHMGQAVPVTAEAAEGHAAAAGLTRAMLGASGGAGSWGPAAASGLGLSTASDASVLAALSQAKAAEDKAGAALGKAEAAEDRAGTALNTALVSLGCASLLLVSLLAALLAVLATLAIQGAGSGGMHLDRKGRGPEL